MVQLALAILHSFAVTGPCRCHRSCWTPSTWCAASGKRSGAAAVRRGAVAHRPAAGAAGTRVRAVRGGWRGKRRARCASMGGRRQVPAPPSPPSRRSTGPAAAFGGACALLGLQHRPRWVDPAPHRHGHPGNIGSNDCPNTCSCWRAGRTRPGTKCCERVASTAQKGPANNSNGPSTQPHKGTCAWICSPSFSFSW